MKIYIDDIPNDGLMLTGQIDPQKLSLGLEKVGVTFIKEVAVKVKARKIDAELLVDVSLKTPVEYTCSRCLAKVENVFEKSFSTSYQVHDGDVIEIDEDVRQELILDYPMKVVCKEDCLGLCSNCGQNLNMGECNCK